MYESKNPNVSHPKHYLAQNGMEVIDVIEAFTANLTGIEATDTGNIIKYACRWKEKGGKQDIEKIIWYAQHLLDYIERTASDTKFNLDANSKQALEETLNDLQNILNRQGYLTISEYCCRAGIDVPKEYWDAKQVVFGWADLTNAEVKRDEVRQKWVLCLPAAKKLNINMKGEA